MSDVSASRATKTPEDWWSTSIIDMKPGAIRYRGYAIEELIGRIGFADMVYLMTRGELPHPDAAKLLEAALVSAVDHGPQAPSIAAARMAITCGVGINNAMASAINMLGDVHGGAGEQCVALYNAIAARLGDGAVSDTQMAQAIAAEMTALAAQGVSHIPGFGHRFHPRDPRAPRLLELVDIAARNGAVSGRFAAIARALEARLATEKGRPDSDEHRRRHRRRVRGARLSAAALPGTVRPVALGRGPGACFRGDAVRPAQQRTHPAPPHLDLYWSGAARAALAWRFRSRANQGAAEAPIEYRAGKEMPC